MGFFKTGNAFRKICGFVLFFHFLFLGYIWLGRNDFFKKNRNKPLVVRTVTAQSMAVAAKPSKPAFVKPAAKKNPESVKKALPKEPSKNPVKIEPKKNPQTVEKKQEKIVKPVAKKTEKKQVAKEEPSKKIKQEASKPPAISSQLQKELQESIARLESSSPIVKQKNAASKNFTPIQLHIDSVSVENQHSSQTGYLDEVVSCLHQQLQLPEFGEVKIELTLLEDVRVAKLVVLSAESEKNRISLQEMLPRIRFPHFSGDFQGKREHVFVFTFCN